MRYVDYKNETLSLKREKILEVKCTISKIEDSGRQTNN